VTVTLSPSSTAWSPVRPGPLNWVLSFTPKATRVPPPSFLTPSLPAAGSTVRTVPAKSVPVSAQAELIPMRPALTPSQAMMIRLFHTKSWGLDPMRMPSSLRRHAAVDGIDRAGHPSGFVGGQVKDQPGHFIRRAGPTEWIGGQNLGRPHGVAQQRSRHRGIDQPDADPIAANALLGIVDREASSQNVEPSLGGDRKSTRLNSSHSQISYAVFCL